MSTEKTNVSALDAMLDQYNKNNAPKGNSNSTAKVYDLKNYFNTFIKDGIKDATKTIRILPTSDKSSPFVEMHGHKAQVDGEYKTFACLKHTSEEDCPFCEAKDALYATGREADKELAKKYNARKMYVVKIIDRDNEIDGVKFWRFNHDYRKAGILDKIFGVLQAVKKDVTDPTTGRDLLLTINRDQNGRPQVSAVASLDPSPLSTDAEQLAAWTSDARTWKDVYAIKSYDYLNLVVRGEIPVWDKEAKQFVAKSGLKAGEGDKLEAELTLGVENVKNGIQAATASPEATAPAAEVDDLPF